MPTSKDFPYFVTEIDTKYGSTEMRKKKKKKEIEKSTTIIQFLNFFSGCPEFPVHAQLYDFT
jgi:hypothetical protein